MRTVARFCFSALFLWASFAFGADWARIAGALSHAQTFDDASAVVAAYHSTLASDSQIESQAEQLSASGKKSAWRDERDLLVHLLQTRADLEKPRQAPIGHAASQAANILRDGSFRDTGQEQGKNWASRSLESLFKLIADFLRSIFGNVRAPGGLPGFSPIAGLTQVMWGIIIIAIVAFLAYGLYSFKWGRTARTKKKAGGLLEEGEPDRTADEWLVRADELERDGRFREAVRCLYLASLVRIDEARVARFVRSETNWEHLRRIMASRKKPAELDIRPITQAFDTIWYGLRTRGADDVLQFRTFYTDLCKLLETVAP